MSTCSAATAAAGVASGGRPSSKRGSRVRGSAGGRANSGEGRGGTVVGGAGSGTPNCARGARDRRAAPRGAGAAKSMATWTRERRVGLKASAQVASYRRQHARPNRRARAAMPTHIASRHRRYDACGGARYTCAALRLASASSSLGLRARFATLQHAHGVRCRRLRGLQQVVHLARERLLGIYDLAPPALRIARPSSVRRKLWREKPPGRGTHDAPAPAQAEAYAHAAACARCAALRQRRSGERAAARSASEAQRDTRLRPCPTG